MSLEALIREPKTVIVGDETILITQIHTKHIPAVMRECGPLFAPLAAAAKGDTDVNVGALIVEQADTVINLVAICINKSVDYVGELEIDVLIEIASAVVEVNASFFVDRVLPLVKQKMAGLQKLAPAA